MSPDTSPSDKDQPVPDASVDADVDSVAEEAAAAVRARLAAEPRPLMPATVVARLRAVLRTESGRRSAGAIGLVDRSAKPQLETSGAALGTKRWARIATLAVAAAVAAVLVGFGGYVVSASAGLNEPVAASMPIDSDELVERASQLVRSRDLDPHRFSRAWQCARRATDGRITGLVRVVVDGTPALLVYTRSDNRTTVTVVGGCAQALPSAGPSGVLPR